MPSLTFDLDAANESDDSNKKSGVQNYALSLLSDLMIVEEFKDIVHEYALCVEVSSLLSSDWAHQLCLCKCQFSGSGIITTQ